MNHQHTTALRARSPWCLWLLVVALFVTLTPNAKQKTEEKVYVGAQTCGACHPTQLAQQSASAHARSLRPAAEHALANSFVPDTLLSRSPNFRFEFLLGSKEFKVRVSGSRGTMEIPIQWAFGAGDQAITFVSQVDEDSYVEHHFSYYSAIRALDATPGHHDLPAKAFPEALGVFYKTFDPEPKILRCFQCHSTGRLSLGPKLEIRPGELGVRCEACHGPGSLHVDAASNGKIPAARKLIQNPRRFSAAELNQFCGACHRKPAPAGATTNWSDPWNTRHQPLYLSRSACFQKSQGALSCLTCHDAHQPLRKNEPAYYNGRCGTCHDATAHPPLKASNTTKPEDCLACHMPKVAPQAHLRFTNHWIGVYLDGATLKPSR